MSNIVITAEKSRNSKTGIVSATYAPIQSCSKTCPFLNNGCYAQCGNTGIHLRRMSKAAREAKKERPVDIARIEAEAIRNMTGEHPLRLHISGDCSTAKAAKIVSSATEDYKSKANQPAWTYTHSWKEIPRERWGDISVLASCETITECKYAMERGYAASIVRGKPFSRPFKWEGLIMFPCQELTQGTKCLACRKCWDDVSLLRNNEVICLFPHGAMSSKAKNVVFQKSALQDR